MIHIVKDVSIISETKLDVFLKFSSFFYDLMDAGNLISGDSPFSKSSLNISKFSVDVLLKSSLEILHITLLSCEMSAIMH